MRRSNVGAARLYAAGLADRPDLAEKGLYNAACAAALAGTGQGDGQQLDEAERARWRKQAIDWLRADLALRAPRLETGKSAEVTKERKHFLHWMEDPDLAGLRDPAALVNLPESEREACRQLWADLDRLMAPGKEPLK
jgi:serine/threonine-protein kinase